MDGTHQGNCRFVRLSHKEPWRWWDSNPHGSCLPADFKSAMSAISSHRQWRQRERPYSVVAGWAIEISVEAGCLRRRGARGSGAATNEAAYNNVLRLSGAFAGVGVEDLFAETQSLWSDFDVFVRRDVLEAALERHLDRWGE